MSGPERRWRLSGTMAALAFVLAAAGCTKTDPPRFQLNIQYTMSQLKLKPEEQANALRPLSGREESRLQTLESEIKEVDLELESKEGDAKEKLEAQRQKLADEAAPLEGRQVRTQNLQLISNVLDAAFGTPDDPFVFPESGLDLKKIKMAAGPYGGNADGSQRGLYRQHCAHCHGITGDGAGPTAVFLNPYPRDYREGKFKFKSTEYAVKPTTADLHRTLMDGVAGTAMPSFALLPPEEVDALVEYVKYLSFRGEVEQAMIYRQLIADDSFVEEGQDPQRTAVIDEFLVPVVEAWSAADGAIVVPGERPAIDTPELLAASIAEGNKLFHGEKAACVKCHGPTGLGDAEDVYFDDWNKDKLPGDLFWLLPKQPIRPRNLRLGIYRGGRRPLDIYRRIYTGIPGGPMPGTGTPPSPDKPAPLSNEEIWHVVNYVKSLPYDLATRESQPKLDAPQTAHHPAGDAAEHR